MRKDEIELLEHIFEFPSIWGSASVDAEPEKWIDSWQVFKVTKCVANQDVYGFHFFGRNTKEHAGAVSSKIVSFDPVSMRGVTNSGRIYQLMGSPGHDGDADYVLAGWKRINHVETEIATQEFLKEYGIVKA